MRMLILGAGMVGAHAGDMIGEVALAIEMGANAVKIGKTIYPYPTLGENLIKAAEIAHGSCTDVPPARKLGAKTGRNGARKLRPSSRSAARTC